VGRNIKHYGGINSNKARAYSKIRINFATPRAIITIQRKKGIRRINIIKR